MYAHVVRQGMAIDSYTLVFAVEACGLLRSVVVGELVHAHVIKLGFAEEVIIATSIVGMYSLFGKLGCARRVFDESPERDLVMLNAVVAVRTQSEVSGMSIVTHLMPNIMSTTPALSSWFSNLHRGSASRDIAFYSFDEMFAQLSTTCAHIIESLLLCLFDVVIDNVHLKEFDNEVVPAEMITPEFSCSVGNMIVMLLFDFSCSTHFELQNFTMLIGL
ncbi:hypothetical protein Sjap_002751 [Stephania japonica]|uniref:Uncharacterized protein n=1 Tax=Stephania japonica TaxID=461633 RepID=A0AAP0KMF6_9MAGN